MKHIGETMIHKVISWHPLLLGVITVTLDNLSDINTAVQILVGLASFGYIVARTFYLIKNKGKGKK